MSFLDFLQSVATGQTQTNPVLQRVAQQVTDAAHPTFAGHDVSGVPILSGLIRPAVEGANYAGLIGEGAGQIGNAIAGAGLGAAGLASRAGLLNLTRTNQSALDAILHTASQGGGNPFQQAQAANAGALQAIPGFGIVDAATNPLNFAGPVGRAGEGLRAIEGAPALLRGLGTALEGASAVGRAGLLPYEAGFGGVGGVFKGVKGAAGPAIAAAAPGVAAAYDSAAGAVGGAVQGGIAKLAAALEPTAPVAPAFSKATMVAIARSGMDPAKFAGLDEDMVRYVLGSAKLGQEDALIASLKGEVPGEAAPAASVAPTPQLDQLRQAATFSDDPAVARAARDRLAALETAPPTVPNTEPPPLAGIVPETGTPGPTWTHYGPETIHPGEGVTPELLDQFAKLRQFPNPSPLDIESEIGAARDPVTMMQEAYGNDWQNRLTALTGGKWGQDNGAKLVNGKIMLGALDLTTPVRDYLENRGGAQAGDFKDAIKALLPERGLPTPAAAAPSLSAPLAQPTGTLDDVRALIQDHARQFNTQYPPLDAKFYAKRANVDPAQVPAMLDQLVREGTLGKLPDGSLGIKPAPTADRAAWQAQYAGQSRAGTDILAAGDRVGASDLTQADLNALSPQERMAALRKLAGEPAAGAPQAAGELVPGTLAAKPPASNYRTTLSAYTDRLYRESNVDEALAVLDPARNGDGGARDLYFANSPDLALGQGANRGVLIEYDPATIQGTINQGKPAWPVAWQSGDAEFIDKLGEPNKLSQAVRSVTVQPKIAGGSPGMRIRLARTLDRLVLEGGWTKAAQADGAIRYTPPVGGAPTPALGGDLAAGGELRPDLGPQADDLIAGIQDAVRGGRVDEANYLVANAADYGVPVSRAQQALNDAADLGGKSAGVEAQRTAIEQSPYAKVFQYFNRQGELKKVNPQTGARLNTRGITEQTWNLPNSGYDEVAAGVLASPEFGNNQNFGQTSDEFWRNAQAAWHQYQALKKPGAQFGGDIAAGGGGFGIVPTPGGINTPLYNAITSSSLLGGSGGTVGGLLGLSQGSTWDERKANAIKGAEIGTGIGAGLGAGGALALPLLGDTGQVGLANLAYARAMQQQAWQTGERSFVPGLGAAVDAAKGQGARQGVGEFFKGITSNIRASSKVRTSVPLRNAADDFFKLAIRGHNGLQYVADAKEMIYKNPTALPALRAAEGDAGKIAEATYKQLPQRIQDKYDQDLATQINAANGFDTTNDPTDLGAANVHPGYAFGRGMAMGLASPKMAIAGPATPLLSGLEQSTLPLRQALQQTLVRPLDIAARMIPSEPEVDKALATAIPGFLEKVRASGQDIGPLLAKPLGHLNPADIADEGLKGELTAIRQSAAGQGGAAALDVLGNFSTESAFRKIVNTAFPSGIWNVGQIQVLARAAARNPVAAMTALGTIRDDYQRHLAGGDPEHAGTFRITTATPGFGALVRLATGGTAGQVNVNPLYSMSPIGGETLDLPRQLGINARTPLVGGLATAAMGDNAPLFPSASPNQNIYEKAQLLAQGLSASPNPLLDMAAYKLGVTQTAPAQMERLAPVGEFADQLLHDKTGGAWPLFENVLGTVMNPDGKPGDIQQQLKFSRYVDPAAIRAGNEMIYEQRGTSSSDPKNVDLVAQLRDPTSDFYKQAALRASGSKAMGALTGELIPGGALATTATQTAEDQAHMDLMRQGLPLTKAQQEAIAADPGGPLLSQLYAARINAAKLQNPLLAVQDVNTPLALGQKVLDEWKRANQGLSLFPAVYNQQMALEQEKLGTLPLGTAMQAQTLFDQLRSGQVYGQAPPYPGMQPVPFDPTPLYDLMRYLNGGR